MANIRREKGSAVPKQGILSPLEDVFHAHYCRPEADEELQTGTSL